MRGCLEFRGKGKDGIERWRLVVTLGRNSEGKIIQVKETFAGKKTDAETALATLVAKTNNAQYVIPAKDTFGTFFDRWIRDYGELNLAPKTLHRYKQLFDSRIRPALGHMRIEKITPSHLMAFYKDLQGEGIREDGKSGKLSGSTVLYHHRLISSILNDAVKWQLIQSNPAARVEPPKTAKKTGKKLSCYDDQQALLMLQVLQKEPLIYRVLISLLLASGARRGEVMGLAWRHIDFETRIITFEQTAQYVKGMNTFIRDETKNETSCRKLKISSAIMELLKIYKAEQNELRLKLGDKWQGYTVPFMSENIMGTYEFIKNDSQVFTTWEGKLMHPDTISSWFPKFLSKYNLPHIKLHGLRHTAITRLINKNIPLKNISSWAGHADIRTTNNIYGHFLESANDAIADSTEELFTQTK